MQKCHYIIAALRISAAYAVMRCMFRCVCVCLSVTFVSCVKTNNHIFQIYFGTPFISSKRMELARILKFGTLVGI